MTVHPLTWADPDPVPPALRLVPDLPGPLGADVLPVETPLDQEVVVRRVVPVTHDVVSVVLEPTLPGGVAFTPGQYLTLALEIDGHLVERCYTIASPPTRPHLLTLTVKRVPDGAVSTYLHERLRPGDRLTARGPLGGFSVAEHPARRYLLLSAGSGVTPTLATLRTMADLSELAGSGGDLDVVVVHSARTPDDLVARAEVEALAATYDGLRVHWVCEADGAPDRSGLWSGPRGRLTADLLRAFAPDVADREVFTCGPPGYMAAVRELLVEVGPTRSTATRRASCSAPPGPRAMPRRRARPLSITTSRATCSSRPDRPPSRSLPRSPSPAAAARSPAPRAPPCWPPPSRPGFGCRPRAPRACAGPASPRCCRGAST